METKPETVPDELLIQAGMVHAQLLIHTNAPNIVWEILDTYMIGLDIWMMQASEYKLSIQLDMEELFSEKTVTTFGFINPKGDILAQLRQCIDNDIETLYKIVSQQREKTYNLCDYKTYNKEKSSLKQHHDKTFLRNQLLVLKHWKMEPFHIPVANLCIAELKRTELLIWAHEKAVSTMHQAIM